MSLPKRLATLTRHFSSKTKTKATILYKAPDSDSNSNVTLQILSWGRGASGQLGGGIEETRLYPAPVGSLIVPQSFKLSQSPGQLINYSNADNGLEIGISCGLFHSGLVVDGKLWIWGKGDGGRLGFGHENSAFVPTLNPYLDDPVRFVALGGMHSVALTSAGQLFSWSVLNQLNSIDLWLLLVGLSVSSCLSNKLRLRNPYHFYLNNTTHTYLHFIFAVTS